MILLGWLLHAFYATAIAYLLSLAFGGLADWISVAALIGGTALAVKHARAFSSSHRELTWNSFSQGGTGIMEVVLFTFLMFAGLRHFIWLFYRVDHGWSTLGINNFGDLPLHITYIRALANGISFPPHNPDFASKILLYPFGPDLYNALWESVGVRLPTHLTLTGIFALCISLVFLRAYASWWGVGAFFLSGGFAGWNVLARAPLENSHQNVEWKNLLLAVFITQRGILFALPAGLFLLNCVRKHFSGEKVLTKSQMTILGLVWAILPLFHLHTFVAISLIMAGCAFAYRGIQGVKGLLTSRMAMIAYLPATLQVLASTEFLKKASVVSVSWGWMAPQGKFFEFMIYNFGLWLLLPAVLAVGILFRKTDDKRALWIEWGVYTFLFVLFFNVMLAPWAWDNIKVLIWPYLGFARLGCVVLEPYIERFGGGVARAAVAFALFLSGFSVVLWSVSAPNRTAAQIYHVSELAKAEGALADVPKPAVFAAATTHDHVLTYFGRMRVVGYEGRIWTHGIDPKDVISKLKSLMQGEGDWLKTAHELGVEYIYWGPQEAALYGADPKPWMTTLKNVSRVPDHAIYLVK